MEYTSDYKLTLLPTDEDLQDACNVFKKKFNELIKPNPHATIMIVAHNEELYLPVMLQTLSRIKTHIPLEIIAVDNASTDRTPDIIKESGLTLITEDAKGVSYARQAGLENSQGKYIFSTDADTQIPEKWIDANLDYFKKNRNLVCLSGGSLPNGGHVSYWVLRALVSELRKVFNKQVSASWSFPGHNMVYLREVAESIGGYQPGTDLGEDNLIARKMRMKGQILRINDNPEIRVLTSARRVSTFARVIDITIARLKDSGMGILSYDKMITGRGFSDIR